MFAAHTVCPFLNSRSEGKTGDLAGGGGSSIPSASFHAIGSYAKVRRKNPSSNICDDKQNNVAPYRVDPRLTRDICLMFVSNYFVFRQETSQRQPNNVCRKSSNSACTYSFSLM